MSNRNRFENKIAVVTGGNSGIGLTTAKLLHAEGATVVIAGRSEDTLKSAAKEIGGDTLAVRADASKLADIDKLYKTVQERFGRVDVLFANAGIASFFPAQYATEENYDALMDTNVKGVYFTIQKAMPLLSSGSSVVINASSGWAKGVPAGTVYAAGKAALRSFARTFAAELVERKGRVNSVSPGPIETPIFNRTGGLPPEAMPQLRETFTSLVPMKRFGSAEEVANVVLFLASSESSYITGEDIFVDGGLATM